MAGSSAAGDTSITGVQAIAAAEMSNGLGDLSITYANTALAGSADVQTLALSGVTGGTFTAAPTSGTESVETIAITSSGSARNVLTGITNNADTKTITVAGTAALTMGTLGAAVTSLDASQNSGGVTVTLAGTTTATVTGSSGNDSISQVAALTTGTVDGGAGTDALVLVDSIANGGAAVADGIVNSSTAGARYANFETLNLSHTDAGNAATVTAYTDRAQDASLVSGITSIGLTTYSLAQTANDDTDTATTVSFTNLGASVANLNISGLAYTGTDAVNNDDVTLTLSASLAANTAADSITVTLGTSTAAAGNAAAAAAGTDDLLLEVTLNSHETINLVSQGAANTITTLNAGELTTLTASGSKALTITNLLGNTATDTINASAMTGAFIMGSNASTTASSITGGSGNDTLFGGTKADTIGAGEGDNSVNGGDGNDIITAGAGSDTINAGAGVDNVTGGAGNDTFNVTTAADFIGLTAAETVAGGEGNDILAIAQNTTLTVVAADLMGLSGIDRISLDGDANAGSITLTDAVFTANGVATLRIIDADLSQGTLTVNASALAAANAIHVTANTGAVDTLTGGAGNDTFVFSTTTGLGATDTVVGGAGTDVISLTATAAVTANMTGVRTVEQVTTTGNGGDVSITVGSDSVLAASATLTVNASSVTNSAYDLAYDGTAITTATKAQNVTGTAGADTIQGGSGNDVIVGADGADQITGGAGIDNLSGGAGDDIFIVATLGAGFIGLSAAETVTGGAGDDILQFAAGAVTIAASDLTGVSGVETIEIQNIGQNASLTLTDAFFTANGAATLKVNATTMTTGVLTLSAGALTAANSVTLDLSATGSNAANAITFGAGNDTILVDLDALDTGTITGGTGNDTITIELSTTNSARTLAAGVTGIETINFATAGVADTYSMITVDANVAASGSLVVNGSNLTGTLTFNGSAELDGTFSITGGAGADTLTGGAKIDTISGGVGADRLTGGALADQLTGGTDADTFVYTNALVSSVSSVAHSSGSNADSITDFVSATDKLEVTLDYSTTVVSIDVNAVRSSAGVAGVTLAQDTLSGQRGQYVYDTTNSALYINVNNDNLITTSDFKININAGATASATIVEGDINFAITGGTAADTLVAGSGADTIVSGGGADSIDGGAGVDTITATAGGTIVGGSGSDAITLNGAGDYIIKFTSATGSDTVTNTSGWASAGADKIQVSMAAFAAGNADTTIDASEADADGAGILVADELVIIQANVGAGLTAADAVVNGGGAGYTWAGASAIGTKAIIAMDDGADTAVFLFTSAAADTSIIAAELTLIGFFSGVAATAVADYAFIA